MSKLALGSMSIRSNLTILFIGYGGTTTARRYNAYSTFTFDGGYPEGLSIDQASGNPWRLIYRKPGTFDNAQFRSDNGTSGGSTSLPNGTIYYSSSNTRLYWVGNNRLYYKNSDGNLAPS